jgi:hypothetical protein
MNCKATNHKTGAPCVRGTHDGPHGDAEGQTWPTRRERTGEVEKRDTSLDLTCVECVPGDDEEERWWVMPTPKRIEAGIAKVPLVIFAFKERSSAELVCEVLNAVVISDAMHDIQEEKELQPA